TLVMARNNPDSQLARILPLATPTIPTNPLAEDIAPQTLEEVSKKYPKYLQLVNALIGFAVENADSGMEGAPERPGNEIMVSEQAGIQAKTIIQNALPQTWSLSSITITEQQATSWLAMELSNTSDLPLSDVQVFLRNGQVQIWGMINGSENSTAALIVGEISIDNNKLPFFEIKSMEVGTQTIPHFLLVQKQT